MPLWAIKKVFILHFFKDLNKSCTMGLEELPSTIHNQILSFRPNNNSYQIWRFSAIVRSQSEK